ncbi:HEPN domain-containing protein [Myxococcota bacterium]|jgi:hypothetical protein|nr:HEPN domain-containing protein [Myxococcota bacterium]
MTEDPVVNELLEEAEDDLRDAEDLGRRPGSLSMALYQASQSAEKFLRALAQARGRPAPLHWDLGRVFDACGDLPDLAPLAEAVGRLAGHATPGKAGVAGGMVAEGIRTARLVRYHVRTAMGEDLPPPEAAPVLEEARSPDPAQAPAEHDGPAAETPEEGRRRGPPGPGPYVRQVWLCERCGVRLPRTRQTGRGAPCPHCNRPMRLVSGN